MHHGQAMHNIIAYLRNGELINAIKAHRTLYNTGLKESKDAVEAIREALGLSHNATATPSVQYLTVHQWKGDHDFSVCLHGDDKWQSFNAADNLCSDGADTVYVCSIIGVTETKRSIKRI
jgi:hypothetical protein